MHHSYTTTIHKFTERLEQKGIICKDNFKAYLLKVDARKEKLFADLPSSAQFVFLRKIYFILTSQTTIKKQPSSSSFTGMMGKVHHERVRTLLTHQDSYLKTVFSRDYYSSITGMQMRKGMINEKEFNFLDTSSKQDGKRSPHLLRNALDELKKIRG